MQQLENLIDSLKYCVLFYFSMVKIIATFSIMIFLYEYKGLIILSRRETLQIIIIQL